MNWVEILQVVLTGVALTFAIAGVIVTVALWTYRSIKRPLEVVRAPFERTDEVEGDKS